MTFGNGFQGAGVALEEEIDDDFFLSLATDPDPLTSDTVELIPALGAIFPRGGPVQDPVLTPGCACMHRASPKLGARTALGSYSRARPRSIEPPYRGTSLIRNSPPP